MASKRKTKVSVWIIAVAAIAVLLLAGMQMQKNLKTSPLPSPSPSPSPTAKSYNGIYKGNLPCADCPGITETLILANDGSYILEDVYQEKSTKPFQSLGKWQSLDNNILKLTASENLDTSYFQVTPEGNLEMLDSNMKKIDSPFNQTLTKQ